MKILSNILIGVLMILYPFGVFFGLKQFSPRAIGAAIFVLFLIRLLAMKKHVSAEKVQSFLPILAGVTITSLLVMLRDDPFFLRFNPALINLNFLFVFGVTLWHPPSMIERFARLQDPDLPEKAILYTRKVTIVWCGFFFINGAIALWTAFQSLEVWTWYNGLISYFLIGTLFIIELLVRTFLIKKSDPRKDEEKQTEAIG